MIEENKEISLIEDKKVKTEKDFVKRLKKFFGNFIQGIENEKALSAVNGLGVKFINIFSKKTEEKQEEIGEANNDAIVPDYSEDIEQPKQEEIEETNNETILDDSVDTEEPEQEEQIPIKPIFSLARENVMPEVEDTIPTIEPEVEVSKEETVEQEPTETQISTESDEEEVSTDVPEQEFEDEEIEEPDVQMDTKENHSSNIILSDLTQFISYTDYLTAYRQARINDKDVDRFWADLYNNNLPSDLLDEKAFIKERKRQEDEKEQRKIETKKAEIEKKLAEERAKHAAASEKVAELQTSIEATEAKLKTQREEAVSLKQQMVDANSKISDLERENRNLSEQLEAAQETAKKAQARSYKDRKTLSAMEKEIEMLKRQTSELEAKLKASKDDSDKLRRELEETKARISKNAQEALDRIKELRTPEDDDIEKTAPDWTEKKLKEDIPSTEEPVIDAPKPIEISSPIQEEAGSDTQKKISELEEAKNQALVDAIVAEAGTPAIEEQSQKTR